MGLLEGAVIALAGYLLGYFAHRQRKPEVKTPKPVCGCGHNASFHEQTTGKCHAPQAYNYYGDATSFCTCQQYTGPEPLPEFYAREIQLWRMTSWSTTWQ